MAASGVYIINDLYDRGRDQFHPSKRLRPIAASGVSKREALIAAFCLLAVSLGGSWAVSPFLFAVIFTYAGVNYAYTVYLKQIVIIDVFCVSFFFLLRLLAGSAASGVSLSHWILSMTCLLALFLGFNKRRQELKWLKTKAGKHRFVLRKYSLYFIDQMISVLMTAVVICYTLYTIDPRTVAAFGTNHLILTVPFVFYGIFRYQYLVLVRSMDGDPTRILIKDRMTQINLFLWFITCIGVIYGRL